MRRALVAPSISASVSTSWAETSACRTGARRRAVETSRTVRGNASRTIAWPSIQAGLKTAAHGVDRAAHVEHPRNAALDHRLDRGLPVEQRPAVLPPHPFVRRRVGKEKMQALEHANERRDAGQLILAQGRAVAPLDPVERAR